MILDIQSPRVNFTESWLMEMPVPYGASGDMFGYLNKTLDDFIGVGVTPEKLTDILYKVAGKQTVFYYYEIGSKRAVIVEVRNSPDAYVVSIVGKNPEFSGKHPYATELYKDIVTHTDKPLLFSDSVLSHDGLALWKRLVMDKEYAVSVYDTASPSTTFDTFTDPSQLDSYMAHDKGNYRFVLSKRGVQLVETKSRFELQRLYETAGYRMDI